MSMAGSSHTQREQPEFRAVDLHGDILLDVLERRRFHGEQQVLVRRHLEALREGQVKVQVLPVYVESRYHPEGCLRQTLLAVDAMYREVAEGEGTFQFIRDARDLAAVLRANGIGVLLAFEGAEAFGRDVGLVSLFYELGLRMVGLTWNRANLLAQGAGEDTGAGLSPIGRALVQELATFGVMLDVSHLNERSFWDVLEFGKGPVLASHSNASAVWQHARNLTDRQISALAERDGLIGLNFVPRFVGPGDTVEKLVDHAVHMASLVGVPRLAVGGDFIDYLQEMGMREAKAARLVTPEFPEPAVKPTVRLLPAFYRALVRRGFSQDEARAIMGDNAIRYLQQHLPEAGRSLSVTAPA
jgi:membrane dipeptidase